MSQRAKPYTNNTSSNISARRIHQERRAAGICVNNSLHGPAFRGGRCVDCWVRKLDAELVDEDGKMRVRARWTGDLPRRGDFFCSPLRPRYAYLITDVAVTASVSPVSFATFTVERMTLDQVPTGATIHDWRWDPRGRKKGPTP